MSVRALKTFLAITRHGTFAAAARDIGLTQAAVSLQMKALEKELNTQLFDRIGRSAILNRSGRNLIPTASKILSLYEDMALTVSTEDLGGSLHIGAIPPTFAKLLPEALLKLRRNHPRVEVRAISGVSEDLATKVERGELDAALVSDPPDSLPKALELHPIVDEPLVFIAHKTLKMTQPRKVLSEEPFIWLARGSWTGRLIDQMLRQHGIQVQDVMELDMPELIAEMVARKFGVSIIPMYDGKWLKDPRLKIWRFDKPRIKRGVSLLQRRAHPRMVITMALLQCLLDVAIKNRRAPIKVAIELLPAPIAAPPPPLKTAPRKYTYGSIGTGSNAHLAGELLNTLAGVSSVHVPYMGGGPALTDLISGQISMIYGTVPLVMQQVKAGRIRAIAATRPKRIPELPNVQTVAEVLPGYDLRLWWAFLAPAGTPKAVIARLNTEIGRKLKDPGLLERLAPQGFDFVGGTPEQLGKFMKTEAAKWAK